MKTHRHLFAALFAALLATTSAYASDPSGTWIWSRQNRDGQSVEVTSKLQLADGHLTGTVSGFRGGDDAISAGKIEGDQISFNVVVNFNGNEFTIVYKGKLEGDTITGTITRPNRDGGGTAQTDWKASRKTG